MKHKPVGYRQLGINDYPVGSEMLLISAFLSPNKMCENELNNCIFSFHQEITKTHFFSAIEMMTVGIYGVVTANSKLSDIGMFMMQPFVCYIVWTLLCLKHAVPYKAPLHYTCEANQKMIKELDRVKRALWTWLLVGLGHMTVGKPIQSLNSILQH